MKRYNDKNDILCCLKQYLQNNKAVFKCRFTIFMLYHYAFAVISRNWTNLMLAETPILWPPDAKSWLIWKDPDSGKDWGQEEKGTTEDEMVGWHHQFNGHGFRWTPAVCNGQGGLMCCGSWGLQRVGHDWATELNWTDVYLVNWYTIH